MKVEGNKTAADEPACAPGDAAFARMNGAVDLRSRCDELLKPVRPDEEADKLRALYPNFDRQLQSGRKLLELNPNDVRGVLLALEDQDGRFRAARLARESAEGGLILQPLLLHHGVGAKTTGESFKDLMGILTRGFRNWRPDMMLPYADRASTGGTANVNPEDSAGAALKVSTAWSTPSKLPESNGDRYALIMGAVDVLEGSGSFPLLARAVGLNVCRAAPESLMVAISLDKNLGPNERAAHTSFYRAMLASTPFVIE